MSASHRLLSGVDRSILAWLVGAGLFFSCLLLLTKAPGFEVVGAADVTQQSFRVELAGALSFVVAPQDTGIVDEVDGLVLAIFAAIAFVTGVFLRVLVNGDGPRLGRFYGVVAAGAGALALDEQFELVETVGYNVPFLTALPHWSPTDLDELVWSVALAAFLWSFRAVIASSGASLLAWGSGAAVLYVALVGDLVFGLAIEDGLEVVGTVLLGAGLLVVTADAITRAFVSDLFASPRGGAEEGRER